MLRSRSRLWYWALHISEGTSWRFGGGASTPILLLRSCPLRVMSIVERGCRVPWWWFTGQLAKMKVRCLMAGTTLQAKCRNKGSLFGWIREEIHFNACIYITKQYVRSRFWKACNDILKTVFCNICTSSDWCFSSNQLLTDWKKLRYFKRNKSSSRCPRPAITENWPRFVRIDSLAITQLRTRSAKSSLTLLHTIRSPFFLGFFTPLSVQS